MIIGEIDWPQFTKFTKVTCSTSNITCINVTCRVKPVSRVEGFLNVQCHLLKPLKFFMASFSVHHQTRLGGNFNHLFSYRNLKLCDITKIADVIPMLKPLIQFANSSLLNGFLQPACPYTNPFRIVNATVPTNTGFELDKMQMFPNGVCFRFDCSCLIHTSHQMLYFFSIDLPSRHQNF